MKYQDINIIIDKNSHSPTDTHFRPEDIAMKRWNAVLCAVLFPVLLVFTSCGTVPKGRLLEIFELYSK
jgi:hypothetical protein